MLKCIDALIIFATSKVYNSLILSIPNLIKVRSDRSSRLVNLCLQGQNCVLSPVGL